MATTIEELVVELKAQNQDLIKGLKNSDKATKTAAEKMTKSLDNFSKKSKKSVFSLNRALETMAGFIGGQLITRAIQGLSNQIRGAANDFREFSSATAEVNSILDKNNKLTEESKNRLIEFSNQFSGTAQGQAKAFYQVVSAGVTDTSKALKLLEAANKAAVAGVTSTTVAINALTNATAVFESQGLTANQASDILFQTVKNGKTTFEELSGSMGKVTSIARSAGLTFAETSGTLAFLTKSGISTSESVTGLKAILTAIIKPTDDARKAAKELGLDLSIAGIEGAGGFAKFMELVREKTGGSTEAIARLFPNLEALAPALNIVTGDIKDFNTIMEDVAKASGSTAKAFKEIEKSADFQLGRLEQELKNISLQATQTFDKDLAQGIMNIRESIPDLIESLAFVTTTLDFVGRVGEKAWLIIFKTANDAAFAINTVLGILSDTSKAMAEQSEASDKAAKRFKELGEDGETSLGNISIKLLEMAERSRNSFAVSVESANASTDALNKNADATSNLNQKQAELDEEQQKRAEAGRERAATLLEEFSNDLTIRNEIRQEKLNEELAILEESFNQNLITQEQFQKAAAASGQRFLDNQLKKKSENDKKTLELRDKLIKGEVNLQSAGLSLLKNLGAEGAKAAFLIEKASAVSRSIIATRLATAQTLATVPYPANLAAAAQIELIGNINTAAIVASALTGLQGGIDEVPGVGIKDNFPALLAPKEKVIDANTNKDLKMFLNRENALAEGGLERGLNVRITIDPPEFADFIRAEFIEQDTIGTSLETA